jgi:putative membrane protein
MASRKVGLLSVFMAVFAMLFAATAHAQNASADDRAFVKSVIETNLAEIDLAHLALNKSHNAEIRQFAQKMIHDHTALNAKVEGIATHIGVSIPSGPSMEDHALKIKLEAESGATFDKSYIDAMVNGHRGADGDFKKEEANGQDPAVKGIATQAEPTVAEHLHMAEGIQGKLQ